MKKLYCGLLMIGALVGMHSISYGAALPNKPARISKTSGEGSMGPWVTYFSEDLTCTKFTQSGELHCTRSIYQPSGFISQMEIHHGFFYRLEREYEKQEQEKLAQQKKATEQVPGGFMVPASEGGWIQKPESKDNKDNKSDK